jgi:UDP-N-acetylmuramate dehydrogenase
MSELASLLPYNSFGIESSCRELIRISSVTELRNHIANLPPEYLILGGGSNILFVDNYDGVVLKNEIKGIEVVNEISQAVDIEVGSGETWHDVVTWAVNRGYGGIENLALIPGTCGAAPIQNIGAYGVELKDVLIHVISIHLGSGKKFRYNNEQCRFGYRDSVFKKRLKGKRFITSIVLRLQKTPKLKLDYWALEKYLIDHEIDKPTVKDVYDAVIAIRSSKLPNPKKLGNAGSFFKNPVVSAYTANILIKKYPQIKYFQAGENRVKLAAGWLIEQCGWKGKVVGRTGAHKDQALVLVNYGEASGAEIWDLAQNIIQSVYNQFGVRLEPEVNIIPQTL